MAESKYPLTLAAVKAADGGQWAIGDALIKECGPPNDIGRGIHDGSFKKLEEAARYLLGEGYEYSVESLRMFRYTAHFFPVAKRHMNLAWGVHQKARTPAFLEAVIAGAPRDKKITQPYIESIRQRQADKERREREEAEEKAQKEREAAEEKEAQARARARAAREEKEKAAAEADLKRARARTERAKEKEKQTKNAPRKRIGPPAKEDVPIMAIQAQFISDAANSVKTARANIKRIKECKEELSPKGIAALTEAALEAANAWTEAARIVRSELVDTTHLSVLEK